MGRRIYIAGGTGYIGSSLIPSLLARGHEVRVLARPAALHRLAAGAEGLPGNALDAATIDPTGCDAYLHMVGTPHPAPWKGAQFRAVDLRALKASVAAAVGARIPHFVYLSVAHPAPVMRAYIEVRAECERLIGEAGLCSTTLRPWYVLGRGHWWPYALLPAYKLAERVSSLREGARRLGLITLSEMVGALVWAVENPPIASRVLDVSAIRACSRM
jgi:uncharacterized protein YbjT (DUF2867 family)